MTKWFAICTDSEMVYLGEFLSISEADDYCHSQDIDTVWLFDEFTAVEYFSILNEHLGVAEDANDLGVGSPAPGL